MRGRHIAVRPRSASERWLAIATALAMIASLMVVYANPARAHNGTVAWGCDGWSVDLENYFNDADITIIIDQGTSGEIVITETGWSAFDDSGTWDDTESHTLYVEVDAYDDDDQPVYTDASSPFSPDWPNGEYSFTLDVSQEACSEPPAEDPDIDFGQSCRMDSELGPVAEVTFTVTDPDDVVESITINGPLGYTEDVDEGDGWSTTLLPADYSWSANYVDGYDGDPQGGEFSVNTDCLSCPIPGAIDLSNSGQLGSYDSPFFDPWGGPVAVDIPEGYYTITLASFDSHSEKPDQTQPLEIWALADGPEGGTWNSPFTSDLPDDKNFEIYVDVGNGPVYVPAITNLYTVHGYIGRDMTANSIFPVCAELTPVTQSITVVKVDEEATADPKFEFTLSGDEFEDTQELDFGESYTWDDLAPGDYELAEGSHDEYELADAYCESDSQDGTFDPSEIELGAGENITCYFDNDPIEVETLITVTVAGECLVVEDQGVGELTVTVSVADGATVVITDGEDQTVATVTQDAVITVPEGDTYTWTATAADGFVFPGDETEISGEVAVETCTPEVAEIIVEKEVIPPGSTEFEFTFDTVNFTLGDNTLADGESSSSGPLAPGDGYSVSEQVPDGWELVSATCDDGSDPSNIELSPGEVVTCTFVNQVEDQVLPLVIVDVEGVCRVDGDDGEGVITVTISIDGAATVDILSGNTVIETFTTSGSLVVPEGQTYSYEAVPADGFEFAVDFDPTGTVSIETCSDEVLPFTGIDGDKLIGVSTMLLGAGLLLVIGSRRREEG